jgi:hypothetical protein
MKNLILDHEPLIRFFFFLGMLIIMAVWEVLSPRRSLRTRKSIRWYSNLGLVAIDTLALRLLVPLQSVGVALYAETRGWGILNNVLLPEWMTIVLGVFFSISSSTFNMPCFTSSQFFGASIAFTIQISISMSPQESVSTP